MNSIQDRIATLILRQLREELTPSEQAELHDWLLQSDQHRRLYDQLTDQKQLSEELDRYRRAKINTWNKVVAAIPELQQQQEAQVIHINAKNRFIRIAAAAIVILLVSAGTIWLFRRTPGSEVAQTPKSNDHQVNDIMPGTDKATLTLADGATIVLAGTKDVALASQQGVSLINRHGELAYHATDHVTGTTNATYNTLTTPRGGQYRVVLPDGSKVWLNAASSLRYPVAFTGKERRVELKGEGYFEVAKNALQPFRVSMETASGKTAEIEVLGTHFDAMAYNDEPLTTTLLEGSVRLTGANAKKTLRPGEQAVITDRIRVADLHENAEDVMTWTKGYFTFQKTPMTSIMRHLSRSYDVEVVYLEPVDELYNGVVPRNTPLQEALRVLALTGAIHFKVEGRKIFVTK